MTEIAPQIDYKPMVNDTPRYKMKKIILNNFATGSIDITSSQMLEFKLPNTVFNLSKSRLNFTLNITGEAAKSVWVPADALFIAENIQLADATGPQLCDLNFAHRYSKISRKIKTSYKDFATNDKSSLLYPCNSLAASNVLPTGAVGASHVEYLESKYVVGTALAAAVANNYSFELGGVPNSVFSLNKDLYFGNNTIYLRIQTPSNKNNLAWTSTSAADPTTGAASIANTPTLSNVVLWLAQEDNDVINKNLMQAYVSGSLKYNIPWTRCWQVKNSSTQPNINIQITPQYGRKIKEILHTVYDGAGTINGYFDANNTSQSKISNYRSYLNTVPLEDDRVDATTDQDYFVYNGKHCDSSAILNRDVYKRNWFLLHKLYEDVPNVSSDNNDSGYNLIVPTDFRLEATTAATALDHLTYITFSRIVRVDNSGIMTDVSSL